MSFQYSKLTKLLAGAAAALVIAGCGGGGGSAEAPPPTPGDKVSGLAAVGAPVTGAKVVLRCANGATGQTTTDDDGRWTLELSNPKFPCLATLSDATSHPGWTLRSIAQAIGHVNITPLTDLVLSRAAGNVAWEDMVGQALENLAADLPAAQAILFEILEKQGFPIAGLAIFTGEFQAEAGDRYDDLLEHIAASIDASDMTYEEFLEVIVVADPDEVPPLNNTQILNAAAVAAMPQLNKAALAVEDGALKMSLQDGTSEIGAYVGSGIGNKAVLQLAGLNGLKLKDMHSIVVDLKGDERGVVKPQGSGHPSSYPYAALSMTIDLHCNMEPIPPTFTLAELRERRRLLIFDSYYSFISPEAKLSSEEFTKMVVTPTSRGWRASAGVSLATGGSGPGTKADGMDYANSYSGKATLENFDYSTYPDACIVDGATGDGGMFRNRADCDTGAALGSEELATCSLPYAGAQVYLGHTGAVHASEWQVKEVQFLRKEGDGDEEPSSYRTYRFK